MYELEEQWLIFDNTSLLAVLGPTVLTEAERKEWGQLVKIMNKKAKEHGDSVGTRYTLIPYFQPFTNESGQLVKAVPAAEKPKNKNDKIDGETLASILELYNNGVRSWQESSELKANPRLAYFFDEVMSIMPWDSLTSGGKAHYKGGE